ncbi:hypothetical protein A3Q56_04428 [Intoshia linei]|uniref:3-oxoacyl-[acyl-carrier-protein] reductase FabG n=1 Tax=Intoshia linei TaxID=1819745 RepID=A0A177B0V5_9BILA|nr:hypothetical protein A3Q56_04428 [Intoshia linei]
MCSLPNKVALITGASSGIGEATAFLFARSGVRLAITGRNKDALKIVSDKCIELSKDKLKPLVIVADMALKADIENLISKVIYHYDQLDILSDTVLYLIKYLKKVNCAGIIGTGSLETESLEQYDNIMNINLRSVFYLSQLSIPHLKITKGNIVNVSSVTGIRSFPGIMSYCLSKSAIDQMTKCAALELAKYQIRVNAINPGVIISNVHKRGGMSEEQYTKFLEHSKSTHPLGRVGQASEAASAIAFLSDNFASSFITGATIPVDGGRHATCAR